MEFPDAPIILASGTIAGVPFKDRVLIRVGQEYRSPDGAIAVGEHSGGPGENVLSGAVPLELVPRDAMIELDDSLDPWDLRLQLRSLANAGLGERYLGTSAPTSSAQNPTSNAENPTSITEYGSDKPAEAAAPPGEVGGCIDSPTNPWFDPTCPSDDRYIPLIRSGYYGIWQGYGVRVRLLPDEEGSTEPQCQLIIYGSAPELGFTEQDDPDAPYVRTVPQVDLQALYTVEGRALIDRHFVTLCGSRAGEVSATAQVVPDHEKARQVAAIGRLLETDAGGDDVAQEIATAVQRLEPKPMACGMQAVPPTVTVKYSGVRSVRMQRTEFRWTGSAWQGDWRSRRPAIYVPRPA